MCTLTPSSITRVTDDSLGLVVTQNRAAAFTSTSNMHAIKHSHAGCRACMITTSATFAIEALSETAAARRVRRATNRRNELRCVERRQMGMMNSVVRRMLMWLRLGEKRHLHREQGNLQVRCKHQWGNISWGQDVAYPVTVVVRVTRLLHQH
jgi:hypothetical protein